MASFRQSIQAYIDTNLSPAARSKILAETAKKGVADLIASGRASPLYVRTVDGIAGADESQVRGTGGGTIHYQFGYAAPAAVFALSFLRARAPVGSGKFRDSFFVSVNGRFIPANSFNADSVPANATIIIGNTQSYDRKVDVQLIGGKRIRFSVPAGIYDDAVAALKAQFRGGGIKARRVSNTKFPGQYVLRSGARQGGVVNSPAIIITPAV